MKRILVLGSTGMAGHVITMWLGKNPDYEVFNVSRRSCLNRHTALIDAMDIGRLDDYLREISPDVIVNCIGILNQYASAEKDKAVFLNSYLPHYLERRYRGSSTRIIHLSTDCVFSGKDGDYPENAFRDGDDFYARTKAIGEIVNNKDITIRTSIIGPDMRLEGIGLFNWFMKSKGIICGYTRAFWNGVTTIELARLVETMLDSNTSGLVHFVNRNKISKHRLLTIIKQKFQRNDIEIEESENTVSDKSLLNTREDFVYPVPAYTEMIGEMKEWVDNNKLLYPHYFTHY
ncbi:MAG: sugar nucleotide-binding protein [Bacillota bacterium]|nr:sugar nucleotide-binding protein [Bacillota bacterium]MDD3298970.1 sugar nucleotide-binding protein [Bacillota bacterium]MDD3851591.1 sugar nucleotide-binding protein [Bacillota bacterium]MDD4708003.1 sugar nucleotide-binding protein [Bacillota bacterium]